MADVGIARLIQSRTDSIIAEVGPGAKLGGGGSLKAKVRARVQEADNKDQAFAEVFIELTGIPEKAKKVAEYAFRIVLLEQGLYEWSAGGRPTDLTDAELTRTLCQPIYTVAISEVAHLAQRMGFNSVKVAWSLPRNGVKITPTKKPRSPKSAAKPVAVKRAKAK